MVSASSSWSDSLSSSDCLSSAAIYSGQAALSVLGVVDCVDALEAIASPGPEGCRSMVGIMEATSRRTRAASTVTGLDFASKSARYSFVSSSRTCLRTAVRRAMNAANRSLKRRVDLGSPPSKGQRRRISILCCGEVHLSRRFTCVSSTCC